MVPVSPENKEKLRLARIELARRQREETIRKNFLERDGGRVCVHCGVEKGKAGEERLLDHVYRCRWTRNGGKQRIGKVKGVMVVEPEIEHVQASRVPSNRPTAMVKWRFWNRAVEELEYSPAIKISFGWYLAPKEATKLAKGAARRLGKPAPMVVRRDHVVWLVRRDLGRRMNGSHPVRVA